MKFTMPIDKTVATRQGHAIQFYKGEPTHVPKECWKEVQAAGAVPEEEEEVAATREPKRPKDETADPEQRRKEIFACFTAMVEENKRGEFTAQGVPNVKAVEKRTGHDLDPHERDELWSEFKQMGSDG